ncbi:MAG TPA: tripartite tricarboxylate transporter permease, partial [Paracoccaceae bacterium]
RKLDVPMVPVILGILLGNQMEANLRRALTISDGDWSILLASPLAIGLWLVAVLGFVLPIFVGKILRSKMRKAADQVDPYTAAAEGADPD